MKKWEGAFKPTCAPRTPPPFSYVLDIGMFNKCDWKRAWAPPPPKSTKTSALICNTDNNIDCSKSIDV